MKIHFNDVQVLEKELRVPLITPELEVLGYLYLNGPTPSQVLQAQARTSPAGFQILKKRLILNGVIAGSKSDEDQRVKLYDLSQQVRDIIERFQR